MADPADDELLSPVNFVVPVSIGRTIGRVSVGAATVIGAAAGELGWMSGCLSGLQSCINSCPMVPAAPLGPPNNDRNAPPVIVIR